MKTNQFLVESVSIMIPVKMKLNFKAMQILMGELQQSQMWAIYLMGLGKDMTDNVTKVDLCDTRFEMRYTHTSSLVKTLVFN